MTKNQPREAEYISVFDAIAREADGGFVDPEIAAKSILSIVNDFGNDMSPYYRMRGALTSLEMTKKEIEPSENRDDNISILATSQFQAFAKIAARDDYSKLIKHFGIIRDDYEDTPYISALLDSTVKEIDETRRSAKDQLRKVVTVDTAPSAIQTLEK